MRGIWRLFYTDLLLYLREPAAVFFTLVFPVLLVVVSGYSFGAHTAFTTPGGLEVRVLDLMLPSMLVMVVASQGLMGVYPVITSMRENGTLKYYRTHPIRTWHLALSQFLNGLVMLGLSLVLLVTAQGLLFGLRFAGYLPLLIPAVVLVYTAFFALGFGLAGLTRSARMAQAVGSLVFFPMLFLSGLFGPRDALPPALKWLSDLLPMTMANDLLMALWFGETADLASTWNLALYTYREGTEWLGRVWFQGLTVGHSILALLGFTAVAALLALRGFRWGTERPLRIRPGRVESHPASDASGETASIVVQGLVKTYGPVRAVDGLDLTVRPGTIVGLLGPNGAGKTTTLECMVGLRRPDRGLVRVLGLDPLHEREQLVYRMGVQLQEAALPARLKVREILDLFAAFYPRTLPRETLLRRLGLEEQRETFYGKLSGGQKQRVFAALALLNDPEVIFLDEITTGLDAHARREIWEFLRELRRSGRTIVLTSHYLEEVQALCDDVVILERGRVVARGRPVHLIRSLPWTFRVEIETDEPGALDGLLQNLPGLHRAYRENGVLVVELREAAGVEKLLGSLVQQEHGYQGLRVRAASLEDVYLERVRGS